MVRYTVLPRESRVWIDARSSLHPIQSESTGLEGWFEAEVQGGGRINLAAAPRGRVEIAIDQLSSGNPLYDREMRRRTDSRRYPQIVGELALMEDGGRDGRYRMRGDVSFHGRTCPVEDEMTLTWPAEGRLCLEGEHEFDIRDFAMEPPKIMMFRVYPDVTVRVRIVAEADGDA